MATYPTGKVHRQNRRKLGKGQFPAQPMTAVVITDAGSVATMTFATPVVVSGRIPLTVTGGPTFVSQQVTGPFTVTQTFSAALAAKPYSLPPAAANVANNQGGAVQGASGTFS